MEQEVEELKNDVQLMDLLKTELEGKKGFCLGFCSARGLVNRALLGCGMVSLAVVLVLSAPAGRLMAKIMRAIYG